MEPEPLTADAPIDAPRDVAAPAPVAPAAPTPVPIGVTDLEAGSLGETESLLGAVMASSPEGEADALRRSLELDARPEAATPTARQLADEAEVLRSRVVDEQVASEAAAVATPAGVPDRAELLDPTERFEVHDAAVNGDRIAQAIEDARQAEERSAVAETEARRIDREAQVRRDDLDERAAVRRDDERDRVRADGIEQQRETARDAQLQSERTARREGDRDSQLAGSGAVAHFGSGRPPAVVEDRGEDAADRAELERVAEADALAPVAGRTQPRERGAR